MSDHASRTEDETLQRICDAVLNKSLSGEGPTGAFDFAKEVARRYAVTAIERAFKAGYEDGATDFIGDEYDDEELSEASCDAWKRYAKHPAPPSA